MMTQNRHVLPDVVDQNLRQSCGSPSHYVDKKDAKVLAELPAGFEKKKYFIALTVAGGELFAGLQEGDLYVTFKKYGKRQDAPCMVWAFL